MGNPAGSAFELLTGRWRSQILHAGVSLGIVDALASVPRTAGDVAEEQGLVEDNAYRLMRALTTIDILEEGEGGAFSLTDVGRLFTRDHPNSLRGVCLWEEGRAPYRVWQHLPAIVREGGDNGFRREYGRDTFDVITSDPEIRTVFNAAMTSYSQMETAQIMAALKDFDTSNLRHVCDVGGGRGYLIGHFLRQHPHIEGSVLELPATLADPETLLAEPLGVADRCRYVAGDMFQDVPAADAYFLKHILHDWNDDECVRILEVLRRSANNGARVLIAEYVVPGPGEPDFAKLFDVHMMVVTTGRERTEAEYAQLLARAGWRHARTWRQPAGSMSVVEGVSGPVG